MRHKFRLNYYYNIVRIILAIKVLSWSTEQAHSTLEKLAQRYGRASNSNCPTYQQPNNQVHLLSGCQHMFMLFLILCKTASKLIVKAFRTVYNLGSKSRMAEQMLYISSHVEQCTPLLAPATAPGKYFVYHIWMIMSISDAMLILSSARDKDPPSSFLLWNVHLIEAKYWDDTRSGPQ